MSTTTAPTRTIDQAAFMNILNSRKTITRTHIGLQVMLAIQGTGQFLPKGHKYQSNGEDRVNDFDRTIYNLKANSQVSMARDANKRLLASAVACCEWNDDGTYASGDILKATELFNQYLNAVQVSFSVIEPSSRKFSSGDMVTAVIALATNDKTKSEQLVVNDVRYKAPASVESTKFDLTSLIGEAEADETLVNAPLKVR